MCGEALPRRSSNEITGLCPSYGLGLLAKAEPGAKPSLSLSWNGEAETRRTSGGRAEPTLANISVLVVTFVGRC